MSLYPCCIRHTYHSEYGSD